MKTPIILGIESSCDETSAAVMQGRELLSQETATQLIHEKHGGVVPELAARAHDKNIIGVVDQALAKAQLTKDDLDIIAVTEGPGLLGSLLVGVFFAKGLASAKRLPLLGIHHTRAHLLANFIEPPYPTFPFLGLIVSGGHTQIVHVKSVHNMTLLGSTLDDAVGEAFDKAAKMMGLTYPGGRKIDEYAQQGNPKKFTFPSTKVGGLNFSFSGIKTAFLYFLQKKQQEDRGFIQRNLPDLCASIQSTLIDMLLAKVSHAVKKIGLTRIVLGGGVACNTALRQRLQEKKNHEGWEVFIPSQVYCTDNAAMIAMAGYFHWQAKEVTNPVMPNPRMAF